MVPLRSRTLTGSSDRLIRPGDLVFLDIQTIYNGYQTCYYRTLCCGKANKEQKEAYQLAHQWMQDGLAQLKPGRTTGDIARAWPAATTVGFDSESEAFGLEYAHGLGVGLWEPPVTVSRAISLDHPVELQENMVIAVETMRGGTNGVRIEEEAVITSDGHELITFFPADILIECNAGY